MNDPGITSTPGAQIVVPKYCPLRQTSKNRVSMRTADSRSGMGIHRHTGNSLLLFAHVHWMGEPTTRGSHRLKMNSLHLNKDRGCEAVGCMDANILF